MGGFQTRPYGPTHQRPSQCPRRAGVATQLLRTHHPRRRILEPHSAVHHRQSAPMVERRGESGTNRGQAMTGGDPAVVGAGFKPAPTVPPINAHRNAPGVAVWQRNYYERIIRDEESLSRIRQYIPGNLLQWSNDAENPERIEARR